MNNDVEHEWPYNLEPKARVVIQYERKHKYSHTPDAIQ